MIICVKLVVIRVLETFGRMVNLNCQLSRFASFPRSRLGIVQASLTLLSLFPRLSIIN